MKLPLDLEELSGGLPEAELEIGFGNGEFAAARAMACPHTFLIGMEVSLSCAVRCARRVNRLRAGDPGTWSFAATSDFTTTKNFANLKIVCTDARYMMRELFADASLDRVIMNFPCPWPKKRHARRRVTSGYFADGLAAVLKAGGIFELVTDEEWYALEAQKILDRHPALSAATFEVNPPRAVTTKYERKWLEMGKNVFRLTMTKTADFTVPRLTWGFMRSERREGGENEEEDGTVHVKTGKPLPECGLSFLFNVSGSREDARWVFKHSYTASTPQETGVPEGTGVPQGKGRTFLLETISADEEFEQRYYLKVVENGGDTLVKLDGAVYLTPAVRFAIEDLKRCLTERG
jgi:tRNA (guanine-N7-)-methyltransferase